MCAAMLLRVPAAHAQRQVAAPVTDPADPKYLTAQTRKMGGPMPAEQMALIFDHLDLALKVFPDQKRIEGVTTLSLRTKAPIKTLILDLFPKFTIARDRDRRQDDRAVGLFQSRRTAPHHARRHRSRPARSSRRASSMPARRRSPSVRPGKAARRGRRLPTASIPGSTPRCGAAAATCSTRASIIRRSSRRRPTSTTPCRPG